MFFPHFFLSSYRQQPSSIKRNYALFKSYYANSIEIADYTVNVSITISFKVQQAKIAQICSACSQSSRLSTQQRVCMFNEKKFQFIV